MDVQLPDGTVVRGVPDGISKADLTAKLAANGYDIGKLEAPKAIEPAQQEPDIAERIAGNPVTRFALGAASPFLGAAQLGAEALGFEGVTEHLKQLEDMKRKGMGEGFDVAGLAGTVLSPAVLGAMKIPAAASVLGRAGQGAAIGGGFGAASPVTGEGDFLTSKAAQVGTGALIGGVIPPAIDALKVGARLGRNIIDPMLPGGAERGAARILADAAGPKRAAIEAELAKNQVLVRGSNPTAPEAAAMAGSPEFSALQKIAANHRPSAYSDISRAQENARVAAIQQVGKTPQEIEAAMAGRKAIVDPLYKAVREAGDVVDVKPVIEKVNDLLRRNPGNRELVTELMQVKRALINGKKLPRTNAEEVSSVLDGLKASMAKEDNKFIVGTLKELREGIAKSIPGREGADRTFEKLSKPINEMQVGQELEKALTKPVGVGERQATFANAMREAPRTIKKATDFSRLEKLDDVLSPDNLKEVKSVLADLTRKAEYERLVPLGRSRAAEVAQPFGLPATGPLNQSYMIFKTVLGRVSRGINEKTLDTMADALQVPAKTLKLLQSAPTQQKQVLINSIISQKIGRAAMASAIAAENEGAAIIKRDLQ